MATKSYKKMVTDMYPKATYVGMDVSKIKIHTIYSTSEWGEPIGQSTISQKEAWRTAYNNLKQNNDTTNR